MVIKISITDEKYIEQIRFGDKASFDSLFRLYYEQLYRFALRFVRDPQESENLVQDVFVKLWVQRSELSITQNAKAYLYTSVKNQALNYIKRESKSSSFDNEISRFKEQSESPEEDYIKDEQYIAIHKAIEELPNKCKQIYLMKRYDNLSYNEISEIQGISVNTVKTQMKRAIKTLSEKLAHLKSFIILFLLKK